MRLRAVAVLLVVSARVMLAAPDDTIKAAQTVRIDVIAADARGRILDNLKASDFDLRDGGVAQAIEKVRFVPAAPDTPRLVAIFLDEYHVSSASTTRVRDAVRRALDLLRPADLVVVMKPLDSLFAIRLTTDRTAAREVVDNFEGRRGDYAPRNSYERDFMAGMPERIESGRTQVVLSALNALAIHFSSYPDQRKTLIVVSEGMGPVERRRGTEYLPTIDTIIRSAQQSNVSIYAVNPADAESADSDTLRRLTAETAGRDAAPDVDAGLRRALDDAAGYYLLTYQVRRPDDGRFHPVQVQVKKTGVLLRARSGYYAPSPDEELRKAVLARLNEPKPVVVPEPAPHVSTLIRPWFGTSRGSEGKTRITFVWEPVVRMTGDRVRRVPVRLALTALAPDDSVLFEGVVLPTGPGTVDEAGAPASRAVFEMAPGRLRLRMAIQDAAQTVLDTDVRSINVRNMEKGISIGTPEVLRARNAREFRALDADNAVPVSSRVFSRSERLLVRFRAYGPGDEAVSVSARLLSRMGPMRDLPVAPSASSAGVNEIDVPLAGLATGEYLIEVSATSASGEAKDVIDFRVTT